MIRKLGVQAYTFRKYYGDEGANEQTLDKAFKTIKEHGYDEIQTAGFGNLTIEKYAELAHNAGLDIVGTHYDYNEMLNNTDEAMRKHKEILKTSIMGIGGMPVPPRTDKKELFKFIDDFNKIGDKIIRHAMVVVAN